MPSSVSTHRAPKKVKAWEFSWPDAELPEESKPSPTSEPVKEADHSSAPGDRIRQPSATSPTTKKKATVSGREASKSAKSPSDTSHILSATDILRQLHDQDDNAGKSEPAQELESTEPQEAKAPISERSRKASLTSPTTKKKATSSRRSAPQVKQEAAKTKRILSAAEVLEQLRNPDETASTGTDAPKTAAQMSLNISEPSGEGASETQSTKKRTKKASGAPKTATNKSADEISPEEAELTETDRKLIAKKNRLQKKQEQEQERERALLQAQKERNVAFWTAANKANSTEPAQAETKDDTAPAQATETSDNNKKPSQEERQGPSIVASPKEGIEGEAVKGLRRERLEVANPKSGRARSVEVVRLGKMTPRREARPVLSLSKNRDARKAEEQTGSDAEAKAPEIATPPAEPISVEPVSASANGEQQTTDVPAKASSTAPIAEPAIAKDNSDVIHGDKRAETVLSSHADIRIVRAALDVADKLKEIDNLENPGETMQGCLHQVRRAISAIEIELSGKGIRMPAK
ncbi:hypothetical protein ACFOY8_12640 [Thalassospira xianhensis]|nr:hypothetical protein [Thalassospira xianhensis]